MRTEAEIDNEIQNLEEKLLLLRGEKRKVEHQKRKSRSKSYERQKELDNLNGDWCRSNLKEGDIVRVKGSRSKEPRLIERMYSDVIQTRKTLLTKEGEPTCLGEVTEHMYNKVTKVLVDGKFVPVKILREKPLTVSLY